MTAVSRELSDSGPLQHSPHRAPDDICQHVPDGHAVVRRTGPHGHAVADRVVDAPSTRRFVHRTCSARTNPARSLGHDQRRMGHPRRLVHPKRRSDRPAMPWSRTYSVAAASSSGRLC
jgi:hypothetical protein